MNKLFLIMIVFFSIITVASFAKDPINFLINMQTLTYNVTNNSGFWNISVEDSNTVDSYHANYFCPLNATACSGAAETDPKWVSNYSAFNTSWSSTYNSTYDAKVTDNKSWNETYANTLYQNGTELFNTSAQMRIAVNNSGYYNITSQQCYYLDNATDRASFLNTSNDSYIPYTGATSNVALGIFNLTTNSYFIGNGSLLTYIVETDPKWVSNYSAFNTSWSNTANSSYVLNSNTSYVLTGNTTYVLTNNASYILGTNTSYVLTSNTSYTKNNTGFWNITVNLTNLNNSGWYGITANQTNWTNLNNTGYYNITVNLTNLNNSGTWNITANTSFINNNMNHSTNNITFSLGGKIVLYNSTAKTSCIYANDTYSFIIDTNC